LTPAGRLELGVGADRLQSDYEKTGIPFGAPPTRYERLTEAVRILKAFFGDEEAVSLDREHHRLQALDAFPGPRGKTRGLHLHPARRTML
jgi:alkanesulfonate monooxygenase SsuD/methylene tetrahydromethanopterin reductase-like flavin-dependent oxidoreductase (luciferase family)